MRLRREDDRLNLAAEIATDAETRKQIATMTSVPQAGISAEDLLGAVIKLVEAETGTVLYVTLTSSIEASQNYGGTPVRTLSAFGIINHADNGTIMMVRFDHDEEPNAVAEKLTIYVNRSAT